MKKYLISIEALHLTAGFALVLSGFAAYYSVGLEMALGWLIFGAMYISMSDIGENEMSEEKKNHLKHILRRFFGFVGAIFSITLLVYYLLSL